MDVYLDKLELHGFKSFPYKTVIKFHKGITAVIGPNGCGKSNIVDAILWVLGEQRIKNLRGENSEDLIFNGSSSQKPLGMTEVGAHFVNNREPLYIARRFFRTGESKYVLNEKYCRHKDIQSTLFDLSLGGRGYFIFEQGSIEKMVSLKSSERRILIEEASGIAQYLERKKETANKLIITAQNLENLEILGADKDRRLKELRNQVNYVQRYRTFKEEYSEYMKAFLLKQYRVFNASFSEMRKKIEDLIDKENYLVKKLGDSEKDYISAESEKWETDKLLKEIQRDLFDINREIMLREKELEKSEQQRAFGLQRTEELKRLKKRDISEHEAAVRDLDAVKKELLLLNEEKDKNTSDYTDLKDDLYILEEDLEKKNVRKSALNSKVFAMQSELSSVKNRMRDMDKRMAGIEKDISSGETYIKELESQYSKTQADELLKESELKEKQCLEAEGKLNKKNKLKEKCETDLKNIISDLRNLEIQRNSLHKQKNQYLEMKRKFDSDTDTDISSEFVKVQDIIESSTENFSILENFYFDEIDAFICNEQGTNSEKNMSKFLVSSLKQKIPCEEIREEPGVLGFMSDRFSLTENRDSGILKNGVVTDTLKNGLDVFNKYGVDVVTAEGQVITSRGIVIRSREKGILNVIDEVRRIDTQLRKLLSDENRMKSLKENLSVESDSLQKETFLLKKEFSSLKEESIQYRSRYESVFENIKRNSKRIETSRSEIKIFKIEKEKLQKEFENTVRSEEEKEKALALYMSEKDDLLAEIQRVRERMNVREKEIIQRDNSVKLLNEKRSSLKRRSLELTKRADSLILQCRNSDAEIERIASGATGLLEKEALLKKEIEGLETKRDEKHKLSLEKEKLAAGISDELKKISISVNSARESLEKIKKEKIRAEMSVSDIKKDISVLSETAFRELNTELENIKTDSPLLESSLNDLREKNRELSEKLLRMRDSNKLNFSAESEYEILEKDYGFLLSQRDDVIASIEDMKQAIEKIDKESKEAFMKAFGEIQLYFQKNFEILFEGGEAELTLTDPDNLLECGLEINAQPPGKKLQSLRLLSGGEKTLTSLAFLFAMFEYRPSPFCVFDEVDASLDEANIQRFLKFLHKLKKNTQFLIITHNFKTMEEADYLYGISMNEPGISTIYSTKMTGHGKFEKIEHQ